MLPYLKENLQQKHTKYIYHMMDDMLTDSGVNLLVGAIFFVTHEKLAVVCHAYEDLLRRDGASFLTPHFQTSKSSVEIVEIKSTGLQNAMQQYITLSLSFS